MFQLHTGSYHALEKAFLEDVLAEKKAEPLAEILVLSPSGHLLTHLQTLLAQQASGLLNVHCLTFYALAERLMERGALPEDKVVSEPALFREIVNDFLTGRSDIPFLSRAALVPAGARVSNGLAGALTATLKDLQDSGARVVDCAMAAREGHLGDALEEAVPALELNVLMYDVLRRNGLRTGADFLRRASERVPSDPFIGRQKAIFLYGFYDLTGIQLDLALAMSDHPKARIYFPYEECNPAYSYAEKLLKDPAFASKCKLQPSSPTASGGGSMDSPPTTAGNDGKSAETEAWSCSGAQSEIWLAAKKILDWADAGMGFERMALMCRTLDPYTNAVREVFEAHRIPYALLTEVPVGSYPLMKTARQILGAREAWSEEQAEELRASPYIKALPRSGRSEEADWSVHVAWAKELLAGSLALPENADPVEQRLWEGLENAVDSLSALDALKRPVSRERFQDVLEEKLEALRLPLSSVQAAGVQVMDVMNARGLSFDGALLIGLNEKLFPRLIREDPFLSDAARSALAQALGARLGRKMDGYQEEKLLFHLAVASARKRLHLSCQRSDEEGKALVVSLYLHDFIKTAKLKLEPLPRAWGERVQKTGAQTLTPKEVSLALHREGRDIEEFYRALEWDRELIHHLLESQREIEAFGALGAHDGLIGKNPLAEAILVQGLSPNTLKDLAECPFKIYGRKVLSLDPEEKEVEHGEITAGAQGKLIHEILEAFYRTKPERWEEALEKTAHPVFKTFEKNHPEIYPLSWLAAQNRILAMLKRFIPLDLTEMKESGFAPRFFETDIHQEIQKLALQGRIDRLDIREGAHPAFRVVDYKTGRGGIGKRDKVETAILKGKNFQLPVYLALAEAWLKGQGIFSKGGSAVFYLLKEENSLEEPLKIDSEFWREYGDRFYKNLNFLVKDIENGLFYIRPSDSYGYCGWCHFSAVCRKANKPTQIRSKNSSQRKAHEECFKP